MTKYYYVTNKDGTIYEDFKPFENGSNYAEAPDWVDDDREYGNALHVVSHNPCKLLLWFSYDHPIAHEVEPIDLKYEIKSKYRCRALKRIRTLTDEEFTEFFMQFILFTGNKADIACENGHLIVLNKCIEMGINPTYVGADMAAHNGQLDCLNRCIEVEVKPTSWGADWAAGGGYLDCLDRCIGLGILPTSKGVDLAVKGKHFDCVYRCAGLGILPTQLLDDFLKEE